jgi:hypothetical protein
MNDGTYDVNGRKEGQSTLLYPSRVDDFPCICGGGFRQMDNQKIR